MSERMRAYFGMLKSLTSVDLDRSAQELAVREKQEAARLIAHIAEFLVGGERGHDLADAPFIFTRPVTILPTQNITLTAELVKSLGQLQLALGTANITFTLSSEPAQDSDLIVLGSYAPSQDLLPYLRVFLADFNISLESRTVERKNASIFVPGIGNVAKQGTGVILFSRTEERSTMILLANDPDWLSDLVNVLASGLQPECAVQKQAALCNLVKPDSSRVPEIKPPPDVPVEENTIP